MVATGTLLEDRLQVVRLAGDQLEDGAALARVAEPLVPGGPARDIGDLASACRVVADRVEEEADIVVARDEEAIRPGVLGGHECPQPNGVLVAGVCRRLERTEQLTGRVGLVTDADVGERLPPSVVPAVDRHVGLGLVELVDERLDLLEDLFVVEV